ncbi:hypothetical protein D9758_014583 [Tetrapyrgos nigripes]|uniref:Serine/threonine-protein phosphatase 4 regulatory subunit 3-like central domain-containing protein n=1 Tax=Tetrapyrgos nigripes TaxID=182062 RepID=A0A8H5BZA3_9AGAR|nr:hypothetical protein D9758_014583 [Tetrapyrgos nigripes]
MNDDGGQHESLSLIVIPPADDSDVGAGSTSEDPVLDVNNHVELIENAQDSAAVPGDVNGVISDEEQDYLHGPDANEMKRVKVYELVGSRWVDQGTAFCMGHLSPDGSEALLTARSERNSEDIILSTTIRSSDIYNRQQDTLIIWTEPDGVDYALSFQDPEGCAEVWNFIMDVQRHYNGISEEHGSINIESSSPLVGPESNSSMTTNILRTGHLPTPTMGIIGDIDRAIKVLARSQQVKERICEYILAEDYIKQLIDVMHAAEEAESLQNLHALCSIMQTILMLNEHSIYEVILDEELFFDVAGMLEYDPEFPTYKANYRDFLHQCTRYHQPIYIQDPSIQRKIHHTYRLQFLKDVVLARVLDDSTFNVLNSCIIFNQIDIITHVQQDPTFMRDIIKLYVDEEILNSARKPQPQPQQQPGQRPITIALQSQPDEGSSSSVNSQQGSPKVVNDALPPAASAPAPSTSSSSSSSSTSQPAPYSFAPPEESLTEEQIAHRREVIFLIQQLCIMGKNVQLPARMALFRSLVDRGILFAVQWALSRSEKDSVSKPVIGAGGEILSALLDHDVNGVRGHVLKQVVAIDKERAAGKRGADKAETIMELCCKLLAQSKDMAIQNQVGDALRVWLDLPPGGELVSVMGTEASQALASKLGRKDDPGTERFMDYFYKDCVALLFKPFVELVEWKNFSDPVLPLTREQTNRYVYLCDLLYNFSLQHQFRSHFFVMTTNIVTRVATLLKAKDKHLRHAAFRFFRLLLKQNNQNIHSQIMKHDILKPILDLTLRESRRDNLLSCSCQEYFEHMRRENMKDLIKFCMTKHEDEIKALAKTPLGGQRFQMFIRRWEMNNEPPPPPEAKEKPIDPRWPIQSRALDAEEEDYFNGEDDDDYVQPISQQWPRTNGPPSPLLGNNNLKRKRRMAVAGALANRGIRPQNHQPLRSLGSLVDYDDEDDTADAQPKDTSSTDVPPSSPKLSHRQVSSPNGPPPKPLSEDEEQDNALEALVTSRPQSPAPGLMASMESLGPMRPGEKRRRSDRDEDEELLERLSKSSKRPDFGRQKEGASLAVRLKTDDQPRKMKLNLKLKSPKVQAITSSSPTPEPSEPVAKDGDTG